jgi:hypothetical protein
MSTQTGNPKDGSRIAVTLPARDFVSDWRRYNLVANYIAEYVSYFFEHRDRAENVISSVFYELLEHMATISREDSRLGMRLLTVDNRVIFEISTSSPRSETLDTHRKLLEALGSADIESLYREILESPSEEPRHQGELGLTMVAHDYRARLSTTEDPAGSVTLHASVELEELRP